MAFASHGVRWAPPAAGWDSTQVRAELHRELGISFARSQATGLWEVEHIPQAVLELFSKRHQQVSAVLAALGYSNTTTSAKDARVLTRTSRSVKSETTAAADVTLREYWRAQAVSAGYDPGEWMPAVLANYRAGHPGRASETMLARHGITLDELVARLTDPEHGLTAHTRRFSVLDVITATADALPYGASEAEVEALTDLVLAHPAFVAIPDQGGLVGGVGEHVQLAGSHEMTGGRLYTTADIPAAEQAILDLVAASAPEQARAVVGPDTLAMAIEVTEAAQGYALSTEQRQVLTAICTGGRAIESLEGPAGTGKTTVMRAARVAWEAQGLVVAGAATAAVAAQGLAAESGIESRTCAQWLRRIQTGPGLAGVDVLVLDEANLTDDRDRAALYAEAVRAGVSKVVEIQDPKQLSTPGCGSMAGYLHAVLGGPRLTENRRQRSEDERAALAAHRDGRHLEALHAYDRLGQVVATSTSDAGVAEMVASWLRAAQGAPDAHTRAAGLVMLAATNDTVTRINEAVQAVRAAEGQLGEAATYALPGGRQVRFHVGDQVLIRRNDRTNAATSGEPVLNGYRGVVTAITPVGVQVAWRQPGDTPGQEPHTAVCAPGYIADGGLDLGYCLTTHKAEGMTIKGAWDRPDGSRNEGTVLVWAPGMDARAQYVGLSRDAGQVIVFGALDQVEGDREELVYGAPRNQQELTHRVLAALADHAAATAICPDDRPVLVDLGQAPAQEDHRAHHAGQQRSTGPDLPDRPDTGAHQPAAHAEPESTGAGAPEVTQQAGPGQHPLPGDCGAPEGEQGQHGGPSEQVTAGPRGYWGDEGWRELTRQLQQVALSGDLPALRAAFEQRHAYETTHLDPHGHDQDRWETWEQYAARVVVTDEHRQRWQELSAACVQAWRDKDPDAQAAAQAAKTAYAQALGPDRAARLRQETFDHLDALRAQRHAQQQWLARPFGTLTDDQLQRALTNAEHTRAAELAAAERARTTLSQTEAAVAAGHGPRVTGLDSQLAELRRVAELADQAHTLHQRLRDAEIKATTARAQALAAQHRAQQVSWWRPGKRDRLAAEAARHAAAWRNVRTEIDTLTQRVQQIRDEAPAALHNPWRHRDTLARAEASYPDDRAHAQRLDENQLAALREALSAHHSAADTAAQRRNALAAEQQLRAEMPPRHNVTEHVQRAHWILQQRHAAEQRAAAEDHHQAEHTRSYHDRSNTLNQGRDHGLSL
jgi:hypothetical protein